MPPRPVHGSARAGAAVDSRPRHPVNTPPSGERVLDLAAVPAWRTPHCSRFRCGHPGDRRTWSRTAPRGERLGQQRQVAKARRTGTFSRAARGHPTRHLSQPAHSGTRSPAFRGVEPRRVGRWAVAAARWADSSAISSPSAPARDLAWRASNCSWATLRP